MRKVSVLIMALVLVFGAIGYASSESEVETELSMRIVNVLDGVGNTFDEYQSGIISRSEAVSDFNEYNAKTTFIFQEAVDEGASKDFIQICAGLDMVMDLYRQGLDELDRDKIELGNKIVSQILTPKLRGN